MLDASLTRDLTRTTLAVLLLGGLLAASFWILRPFLAPLVWAALLAIASWPAMRGLQRRLGSPRGRILAVFEPRSNTMKLGTMKSQLPWSLEAADLAFCHTGGLDWDAVEALAPMGARAQVGRNIDELVAQVTVAAQAGDHIVCMSNGGFGGVHDRLLKALAG